MSQTRSSVARRGTVGGQQSSTVRYLEKKKEVEAVMALESASTDFANRFQALKRDMDVVAEAANGTVDSFSSKGGLSDILYSARICTSTLATYVQPGPLIL